MPRPDVRPLAALGPAILTATLLGACAALPGGAQAADPPPRLGDCTVFPADNVWNSRVDHLSVLPESAAYVAAIGRTATLHPDFGSGTWDGAPIGIPWVAVGAGQRRVAVTFYYPTESDPGPYPIPADAPIEGAPIEGAPIGGVAAGGDRHVLVVDTADCVLYELYDAELTASGAWAAGSGAVFDLTSNDLRPDGWTSADAAGLPILPGLVRYDEVAAGAIHHAIRFTAPRTRRAHVWPARHDASSSTDPDYPPMGQRFRLRADFDATGMAPEAQVIVTAMQRYGVILADNGSSWFISGAPDERWDNAALRDLKAITGADFEAVDGTSLMVERDSARVRGR